MQGNDNWTTVLLCGVLCCQVSTPFADVRLAQPDLEAIRDLAEACCPEEASPLEPFCSMVSHLSRV
jgi:hypothetical protein